MLTAGDVIDRIRWQIEGWLHAADGEPRLTAGITSLRIVPIETVPTGAHQQALWGGDGEAGERARRALARVQTMLGFDGVVAPSVVGGRGPAQRNRQVVWGEDRAAARRVDEP